MNDFLMGTVEMVSGVAHIRPDSARNALQKPCRAPKNVTLAAGDRVLLLKYGGVFLVIADYGAV